MSVNDEPIRLSRDDLLGRDHLAKLMADEVLAMDDSEGAVVGVAGPWGSGKTSLINLVENHLNEERRVRTVWFNPWLFSGTGELVERFFEELSIQLGSGPGKFSEVASAMADYGKVLTPLHRIPVAGGWFKAATEATGIADEFLTVRKGGVQKQRANLRTNLEDLDTKLLIVIDDIDRLDTTEIKDIFKLVRLTANFPKIVFLLAFDRVLVEQALSDSGMPGRAYLEKIIQVVHDIPEAPQSVIAKHVQNGLETLLSERNVVGPSDKDQWFKTYKEIVSPLIATMRNAKRYLSSIRATVYALAADIDISDLLTIEAIRIFMPDFLSAISRNSSELTSSADARDLFDTRRKERTKKSVSTIIEQFEPFDGIAENTVKILFPAAWIFYQDGDNLDLLTGGYLRDRRIAHKEVFQHYISRFEGPELLAMRRAEQAIIHATDRVTLDGFIRELPTEQWEDVVSALEELVDRLPLEAVVPTSTVLLNLLYDIPDRPRKLFDVVTRQTIPQIVFLLLLNVDNVGEREEAISEIYPHVKLITQRKKLWEIASNQTQSGKILTDEEFLQQLSLHVREDFRAASAEQRSQEPHLIWLAHWVKTNSDPTEPMLNGLDDPTIVALLIQGACLESINSIPAAFEPDRDHRVFDLATLDELLGSRGEVGRLVAIGRDLIGDNAELAKAVELAERFLAQNPKAADSDQATSVPRS